MLNAVPSAPSPEQAEAARRRRDVLLAAMAETQTIQADLYRRMIVVGETTHPTTLGNWITGKSPMTEMTLRGLLTLMGVPPDWKPSKDQARSMPKTRRAHG